MFLAQDLETGNDAGSYAMQDTVESHSGNIVHTESLRTNTHDDSADLDRVGVKAEGTVSFTNESRARGAMELAHEDSVHVGGDSGITASLETSDVARDYPNILDRNATVNDIEAL